MRKKEIGKKNERHLQGRNSFVMLEPDAEGGGEGGRIRKLGNVSEEKERKLLRPKNFYF